MQNNTSIFTSKLINMKKLPKEQHKKRVLLFVEPEIVDEMTKAKCQEIGKAAIKKEYKKRIKNK